MSTMNEYPNINCWKNEDNSEYENSVFKTGRWMDKSCNKLTLIVFNPPMHHHEKRFSDQINLITSNGKILKVLQFNKYFNLCQSNLANVNVIEYMNEEIWGMREINKIIPNSIKTLDPQISQLLAKVIFSRANQSPSKAISSYSEQKIIQQTKLFETAHSSQRKLPLEDTTQLPSHLFEKSQSPHLNSATEEMYSHPCVTEELPLLKLHSVQENMYIPNPRLSEEFPSLALNSDSQVPHPRLRTSSDITHRPRQAADSESKKQSDIGATSSLISLYSSHKLPVAMRSTSFLPNFMEMLDDENYDPFEHRHPTHPTTDLDTLIHLIKGSLGSGILAMPWAFKTAGLFFGLFATCLVGCISAYCVHILVKCSHILCKKLKVPCLGFDDIAEVAFFAGPQRTKKFAKLGRFTVNFFLVADLLGCCCCYVVFVGRNLKQVLDANMDEEIDLRICMLGTMPLFVLICMIPHLKWLAPLSMVANLLMALGMLITFYYIIIDLPSPTTRPQFSSVGQLPMFFGTCIFALEGIGVVMPLENNMKTPQHFLPCFGVLNFGMGFVVTLYACLGFLGYLRYGDATEASITLNLPDSYLAQAVKSMIAIAIFLTYALQFHVPLEIIWKGIKHYFPKNHYVGQYILRISLVITTVLISVAIPHLGPFISLVGALCLSFLGLLFPAIVEILVYWDLGFGFGKWMLWKNIGLILFGLLGFFTGSYVSILDIIAESKKMH